MLARLAVLVLRTEVIMHAHHDDLLVGHLGWNWMVATIEHKYWWLCMSGEIA